MHRLMYFTKLLVTLKILRKHLMEIPPPSKSRCGWSFKRRFVDSDGVLVAESAIAILNDVVI